MLHVITTVVHQDRPSFWIQIKCWAVICKGTHDCDDKISEQPFLLTATVIGRLKIRCRGSSSLGRAAGYGGGPSAAGWSGGAAARSSPGGGAREPTALRKPTSTASPATVTPQTSTQLNLQPAGTDLLLLTHCRTGNSHTSYLTTDESCEKCCFIQSNYILH